MILLVIAAIGQELDESGEVYSEEIMIRTPVIWYE